MDEHIAANRLNWDERAELHSTDPTGNYCIARVLEGGSSLHQVELAEIGEVSGKDIVHLQCHIGLDTISLKRLGARSVTGLDFSPKAIAAARDFAAKTDVDVRFVEAPVYDAVEALNADYDMVFVTWGAINWLDDITRWARVVAALLRPGGKLYLLEGHPTMLQFDMTADTLRLQLDWRTPQAKPLAWDDAQTYTGDPRPLINVRTYEWLHPLSSVINALVKAGLSIDFLNEHDVIVWKALSFLRETGKDQFELPPGMPRIPLSFSIAATKRG